MTKQHSNVTANQVAHDMRRSSRKAWNLIRKLGYDQTANKQHLNVTANQVAHQLVLNGKTTHSIKVKSKIHRFVPSSKPKSTRPFTEEELNTRIKSLKNGKAIGLDNISVEEIKHFGLKARKWLLQFFNNFLFQQKIPRIWRRTKVVALLKPGKNCSEPKSYRPISLLSHLYKLLERLLLKRIAPIIKTHLMEEQDSFCPGKLIIGQLLNLTQHIKYGYQKKKITGAVFVDLTAAYDTVNHCLLQKVLKMTDNLHFVQFLGEMLRNRRFFIMLNNNRLQKNGLPQGSVLAPLLYNIYTNDQPLDPETKRFVYADDLCVTSQYSTFTAVEKSLTNTLNQGFPNFFRHGPLFVNNFFRGPSTFFIKFSA